MSALVELLSGLLSSYKPKPPMSLVKGKDTLAAGYCGLLIEETTREVYYAPKRPNTVHVAL